MDNTSNILETAKRLSQKQKSILKSLFQFKSSLPIEFFGSYRAVIVTLQNRGFVEIKNDHVFLTSLGEKLCEEWQTRKNEERNISPEAEALKEQRLAKSNQFLELYKQGLSYQDIGDKYGLSRERVRQILKANPLFRKYLKEREEAKAAEEIKKVELAQKELYAKSIANSYPERVAQLWDYEKNGDLKPEDVPAGTVLQYVWFKCPIDGHSWKKKPNDITTSWTRSGTSGCPMCAGKTKKSEKQSNLVDVYPELVSQYWNYKKNNELSLDPQKNTLGSNKKAWFKCPNDGNEWQASIASTISQQWSKGNTGCQVCNGTNNRKRGEWKRGNSIVVEFPDEVAKYWFYEANNELGLNPTKLTTGSSKEAFFKCPIDGHEWVATITAIAKGSWRKGNSGCPACRSRGQWRELVSTEATSLIALYPDHISKYWDYEKNNAESLHPDKLTRGSQKEAWFKCPIDGYEWKTRIGSITKSAWNRGNSGCARCGSGWTLEAIRQFVGSLEVHIPNLTQAELYKIFEQSGVLDTQNLEGLKIVKDIIKGKLSGQKLRDVIQGREVQPSESEINLNDDLKSDIELKVVDAVLSGNVSEVSQALEDESDSLEKLDKFNELPSIKVQKSLEFLSSNIIASADQEAIGFFVASRSNRIWAEVFEDESAIEGVENFTDEGYGRQVRDQFLDEYNQARDMSIPSGWAFRVNGKITPPNLMQKLAAVRLRSQKRMLNLSLTGTGKTIGGILSSRIIDAHLTIIICPLDTIPNWHGEIKQVFPDSKVTIKNFNPYWTNVEDGHYYIVLNHEMFQQPSTADHIRQLLDHYQIDLIIVDEIHRCKQRGDDPSKRRQMRFTILLQFSCL
jgi:hypothetical protein